MRRTRLIPTAVWFAVGLALSAGCQRPAAPVTLAPPAAPKASAPSIDLAYVQWLEERSILEHARRHAAMVSGNGVQWQHPYGEPQTRQVVRRASVWLLDYPGSVISAPGRSVVGTWADPRLWATLQQVGIDLLHTGPVHRAGGVQGRDYTPSLDGWFDPIALEIDPALGTEAEYRQLVQTAAKHNGLIAGDLVPLHTGTGPDFRLAQMAHRDYPGIYTMVEVRREDWPLLPAAPGLFDAISVPKETAVQLTEKGYLPGLINNNDASENARKLSGWAATGEVVGVDGKARRWVFLYYFKTGQPSLNWLDPSLAAPRAVLGDVTHQIHGRGARVLRFDAVPFLGIEPVPGKTLSKHYQHPLSVTATNQLAFLTRKLGGWSFHELNVPLTELKKFTANGPDLSYDFFTRAQCLHALLAGDAGPLRQSFEFLQQTGVAPLSLVHDLQNHDEITYQLVELEHRKDEKFTVSGQQTTGGELREQMLQALRAKAAGAAAPHNKLYRPEQDGLATTFAGFVAAALEIRDPYHATPEQAARIRQGHLLLAMANAMQPGVFCLSSWDLVGALPVPEQEVAKWARDGDYRWVNRGGVDLMGHSPDAVRAAAGLPRAQVLYGPLPVQLQDPQSFASQLRTMLAARKKYRIAEADLVATPEVRSKAVCLLIMKLPESQSLAITALNFGQAAVEEELDLTAHIAAARAGSMVVDAIAGSSLGELPASGRLRIKLEPLAGKVLVISVR